MKPCKIYQMHFLPLLFGNTTKEICIRTCIWLAASSISHEYSIQLLSLSSIFNKCNLQILTYNNIFESLRRLVVVVKSDSRPSSSMNLYFHHILRLATFSKAASQVTQILYIKTVIIPLWYPLMKNVTTIVTSAITFTRINIYQVGQLKKKERRNTPL